MKNNSLPRFDDDSIEVPIRAPRIKDPGLRGHMPFTSEGTLVDLSPEGAGFETSDLLPLAHSYQFAVTSGDETLDGSGEICWHRLAALTGGSGSDTIPVYRCGLRFVGDEQTRRRFLARHATGENGVREPPRYTLQNAPPVEISVQCPFEVASLSRTGMLIDIDLLPAQGTELELVVDLPSGPTRVVGQVVDNYRTRAGSRPRTQLALHFSEYGTDLAAIESYMDEQLRPR